MTIEQSGSSNLSTEAYIVIEALETQLVQMVIAEKMRLPVATVVSAIEEIVQELKP